MNKMSMIVLSLLLLLCSLSQLYAANGKGKNKATPAAAAVVAAASMASPSDFAVDEFSTFLTSTEMRNHFTTSFEQVTFTDPPIYAFHNVCLTPSMTRRQKLPPAVHVDSSSCYEFLCFNFDIKGKITVVINNNSNGNGNGDGNDSLRGINQFESFKRWPDASRVGALSHCDNVQGKEKIDAISDSIDFVGSPSKGFFTGSAKYLKGVTMALYNDYGCGLAYGLSGGAALGSTGNNPAHLLWRVLFPWHFAPIAQGIDIGLPPINHILVDPSYASGTTSNYAMGMARIANEIASADERLKTKKIKTRLQPFSLRPYLTHICMETLLAPVKRKVNRISGVHASELVYRLPTVVEDQLSSTFKTFSSPMNCNHCFEFIDRSNAKRFDQVGGEQVQKIITSMRKALHSLYPNHAMITNTTVKKMMDDYPQCIKTVFVYTKEDSCHRRMINWDEVIETLSSLGLDVTIWHQLDGKEFESQAFAFYYADMVIHSHGAQMANAVFMRPGTILMEAEFLGKSWIRSLGTATAMDVNYITLMEPEVRRTEKDDYVRYRRIVSEAGVETLFYDSEFCPHDFIIDIDLFKKLLQRVFEKIPICK